MTETPARRRAPGMSPERRREMIVAAALPLVAEFGTAVSTATIARAAGIGEATLFRAFTDKDELIDAVIAAALDTDHVLAEIAEVSLDQPIAARLTEVADALTAHLDRIGTVLGAVHASGRPLRRGPEGVDPGRRDTSMQKTRDAVAELLEPERDTWRLPVDQAAALFLNLMFARIRPAAGDPADTTQIVDVFLHGALTTAA